MYAKYGTLYSYKPFFALHISRSPKGLIISSVKHKTNIITLAELEYKFDQHDIHHDPVVRFDIIFGFKGRRLRIYGSVNGLIF